MKIWIRRIAVTLTLLGTVFGSLAFWAVQQTQHVPEFYRVATEARPVDQNRLPRKLISQRLAKRFEDLHSAASKQGNWRAAFTNDEINAWLAEELPSKFPHLLRRGISEPRVAIVDGKLIAAARFRNKRIDTVVSCDVNVELTEEANLLAIRLKNLRAGALSLPWNQFLDRISHEAAIGDLSVQWDLTDAGPVALLSIPSDHPEFVLKPVVVESIELIDGQISLAGRSGRSAECNYDPKTPVHRFVSYNPRHQVRNKSRQAMLSSPGESGPRIR